MIKLLLEFDNKKYIYNYYKNEHKYDNNSNYSVTIYDIFKETIDNKYSDNFTNNIKNYYFIIDEKIIKPDINIDSILCNNAGDNTIITIQCYLQIKGGGIEDLATIVPELVDLVIGFVESIPAFVTIGNLIMMIINFIIWYFKFLIWFAQFTFWIFVDLLNPVNFFNDFFNSVILIIYTLVNTVFTVSMELVSVSVNTIGGWMQGFWGWDQSSLTQFDKESNYFKKRNLNNGKKCYLTNTDTVPFSVILGTILCPPMGVFMDMGLSGWLNILICVLLTFLYYIPGLTYALLIIYS